MKFHWIMCILLTAICLQSTAVASPAKWLKDWRAKNPIWRGVHIICGTDTDLSDLAKQVPALAQHGVNVLIVEVGYSFQFEKKPEMKRQDGISKQGAKKFAQLCRDNGIRVIPEMNSLGHQSWAKDTETLLIKHPEFDETPGQYPENKGIYCRSWCPQHPDIYKFVESLMDEVIDAFEADAFHVGMDEVFLIASEFCPRCKGGDPAKLFAKAVNEFYSHIVKKRKLEMLMWGDRLINAKQTHNSEWEASANGTDPAIDLIPKDIIMCDWHYAKSTRYLSVNAFVDKGFRVWPSSWRDAAAAEALATFGKGIANKLVLGHLVTTWGAVKAAELPEWQPLLAAMRVWTGERLTK